MASNDDLDNIETEMHKLTTETIPEIRISLSEINGKVGALNKAIEDFVTHAQFYPVKLIAYGLAGGVLISVLAAVLSRVILK